jgi:hypothetical protein
VSLARPSRGIDIAEGSVQNIRGRHCIQKLEEMDPAVMGERISPPVILPSDSRLGSAVRAVANLVKKKVVDIVGSEDVAAENRARLEQGYRTTVGEELRKNLVSNPSVLVERARTTNVMYLELSLWSPSVKTGSHNIEYYPVLVRVAGKHAVTTKGEPFLYWVDQSICTDPDVALLLCYFPNAKNWYAVMAHVNGETDEWLPSTQLWSQGQVTNVSFKSSFSGGGRIARRIPKVPKVPKAPKTSSKVPKAPKAASNLPKTASKAASKASSKASKAPKAPKASKTSKAHKSM